VEEKRRFWRWAVLPLGGDPISEEASGSHRISVGSTVSNRALAGSAYREQWVSNSGASTQTTRFINSRVDPNPGFKNIPTVVGPMARTVEDIEIASRVVFGKSTNYSSAPVPYREVKLGQKLKFGYYFNDGMARATPACCRAVSETVEALRKQGHECVEFELPSRALPTSPSCLRSPYSVRHSREGIRGVHCSRLSIGERGFPQEQRSKSIGEGRDAAVV